MMKTIGRILSCLTFVLSFAQLSSLGQDAAQYRQAMAETVRTAAGRVLPSVVTIEIIGTTGAGKGEVEQDAPTSGVIVDADGHVLASSIILRRPSATILIVTSDGTRHTAEVIAQDHHRDLALLKIRTDQSLWPVSLKQPPQLQIGMTTVAVGRYGGDGAPIISTGILSAEGRLDGIALQTDARVSPAFYGGPLIDLNGNMLGLLVPAIAEGGAEDVTSWYDAGIAFAIPSDVIATKLDRLKSGQDIHKGLIGIVAKSQDTLDLDTGIAAVRTRSPADLAGIQAGDQVMSVNQVAVRRHQEIKQVLGSFDAGETVSIGVLRDGKELKFEIVLAESIPPLKPQRLGIAATEEMSASDDEDDTKVQVVVSELLPEAVSENSLQIDDVITRVGKATIGDIETLRRQLISAEPGTPLKLKVLRADMELDLTVTPESIAGELPKKLPKSWLQESPKEWNVEELKLPDSANIAAMVVPTSDDEVRKSETLGLLVLLLGPGEESAKAAANRWKAVAQTMGVVVCAIEPEDTSKWQAKEIDVIANFVAAVEKKVSIHSNAIAVASSGALVDGKATAADAMALAVAISQSKKFFGVAVSVDTRPPAVRLRENEPSASLQVLMPAKSKDDLPPWVASISASGYPIVLGGEVSESMLLRWVRLLQAI